MGSPPLPADPGEVVSSPAQQTVQLIRSLHRERRGIIQFLRLPPGGGAAPGWPKRVPASDLDAPGFANDLLAEPDTLMTINGLRDEASNARAENVRYLNALWADCDCHDLSIDEQEARLHALEGSGLLPPPSVVVWSGRGFWLLWKLTGGRGTAPPTVDEGRAALHREIASEIVQAIETDFPELRPDKASTNVNRLTRVPGSINSKSGTPVRWEVRDLGKCYRLEEWPRIEPIPTRRATPKSNGSTSECSTPPFVPPIPPAKMEPWDGNIPVAKNARGSITRWEQELEDFERLRKLRGGFHEGTRNSAVWFYAYMLRQTSTDEEEVVSRVRQLAAECDPPLSDQEWRAAVGSSRAVRQPITRLQLVSKLSVRPGEADQLEKWNDPLTQRRRDQEASARKIEKRLRPSERHELIWNIVEECGGVVPSRNRMHQILRQRNVPIARKTVSKDYRSLGIVPGEVLDLEVLGSAESSAA